MSELMHAAERRWSVRWQLLATVSTLALVGSTCVVSSVGAAESDGDSPTVWIELGGQLNRLADGQETFAPPFILANPDATVFKPVSPLAVERPPLSGFDTDGKISIQPHGSDWVFSASVRYGGSQDMRSIYRKNEPTPLKVHIFGSVYSTQKKVTGDYYQQTTQFVNANAGTSAKHAIVDFQIGKDVGLGIFGNGGNSILNAGVRFAQFNEKSHAAIDADPNYHFGTHYFPTFYGIPAVHWPDNVHHSYHGTSLSERNFHGVGPSISWNASALLAGEPRDGEFALNWGANAAVLFGHQRTKIHHQTSGSYHKTLLADTAPFYPVVVYHNPAVNITRTRSVIVPNVGGSIGASYRIENFKVSAGYRVDFFFGAIDGGMATAKSYDRGFYGPFATVSVGLGG